MPANSFKTRDVTPKGYGPNESRDMDREDRASRAEARTRKARRAMQQDRIKQQQALTKPKNESLDEISKDTLKSYIPKAAGSLSHNAQGRAYATRPRDNEMKDIYDQRMKVRTKGIHTATQKLAKEDNDIANMIDKTNPGYAKKIAKSKAKIAKDSTPASRYMSKRKDKLKSMVVKESSASDRVAKKLNDMETQKSFATGKSKIPDYSQRPRNKPYDLSKKVQTVKEAAKKEKDKKVKPETFQNEPTLNNNISKNDSN